MFSFPTFTFNILRNFIEINGIEMLLKLTFERF